MNFSSEDVNLDALRRILIRLEDSISFALIERAQFAHNASIYDKHSTEFSGLGFDGSFVEYLLYEMETCHAKVRRYTSPDEYPFTDYHKLPQPVLKPFQFPKYLREDVAININKELYDIYVDKIIPSICKAQSNDGNFGSSATRDVECLQYLSKRIHYGKFIAETKYRDPLLHDKYTELIRNRDEKGLMELLTNEAVEERLLKRVRNKIRLYGQDITEDEMSLSQGNETKISSDIVVSIYRDIIIPLTKKVEVVYLLQRKESS